MKKKKSKLKKLLIVIAIIIMNGLGFMNSVYAAPYINSAYLYSTGDCGQLLNYKGGPVETEYVQYSYEGVDHPAYCLDRTKIRSTCAAI